MTSTMDPRISMGMLYRCFHWAYGRWLWNVVSVRRFRLRVPVGDQPIDSTAFITCFDIGPCLLQQTAIDDNDWFTLVR